MAESMESAVNAAFVAVLEWQAEAREALWRAPSRRQVEATIRAQFERAEAAEAQLAEVREVIKTFFTVYGNNTAASLTGARDLAEGIRQVLDRVPLGTQEHSGEKGVDRG
jgi:hypothetical protein